MAEWTMLSPTFQKVVTLARKRVAPPKHEQTGRLLDVSVVFTSAPATTMAIRAAGVLADRLNARIRLIVPQVVPYPLPLESPPILLAFSEQCLRTIARCSRVETTVQIYLCRDSCETLNAVLPAHSLVVIGGRKRWFRTREQRLAAKLRHAGHEVIFTETE